MTRKEAVETLRANYPDKCFESLRNAVDIAIESLEADVPDKNVGDMISRQGALSMLSTDLDKIPMINNSANDMIRRDERIMCIDTIRALPSAQPERKNIFASDSKI